MLWKVSVRESWRARLSIRRALLYLCSSYAVSLVGWGQANDGLVAAGQQVGVVVVEVADVNTHGAARLDEGWGAGIGVEDFLLGGFGGLTVALVVADIVGAAVHVNEGVVWVGVVVPGDEADAVVGAGAVGGVVGEAVIAGA